VALQKSSPKKASFAFDQTKALPMEQSDLRDMFRKTSKSIGTSTILASPNLMSPTPPPSATKLQKTKKMTLNQQMKKISKWSTPLISCTAQLGVKKNHLTNLDQYR